MAVGLKSALGRSGALGRSRPPGLRWRRVGLVRTRGAPDQAARARGRAGWNAKRRPDRRACLVRAERPRAVARRGSRSAALLLGERTTKARPRGLRTWRARDPPRASREGSSHVHSGSLERGRPPQVGRRRDLRARVRGRAWPSRACRSFSRASRLEPRWLPLEPRALR